jgi:hypothetical protein
MIGFIAESITGDQGAAETAKTGTCVKSFQIFYTDSKSLSEPVGWLKTISIQAVFWQFSWFAFPDARGLQAC